MRRTILLAALLVGTVLAAPVHAQDPTPDADTWIEADWTVTARRLDAYDVDGVIGVHEAVVDGQRLTADEIRAEHQQAEESGQGQAFRDGIEDAVRDELASALATMFPDADREIERVEVREATLTPETGTDPYHPTVDVDVQAAVETDLPGPAPDDVTRDRIRDALTMGASTPIDVGVEAEAGANHTVTLQLPPDLRPLGDATDRIHVTVDNWNGSATVDETVRVEVTGADATRFRGPDGSVDVRVDLHDVSIDALSGSGTVQADLRVDAEIRALAIPPTLRDAVPPGIDLDAVGADGLRLAIERGYVPANWTDRARDRFDRQVTEAIQGAFGPGVAVDVILDDSTLQGGVQGSPDADPPITVEATARAERRFSALGGSGQAALVVTSVEESFTLDSFPPFTTRYEIVLPDGLALESARLDGDGNAEEATIDGRDALVVDVGPDGQGATATMSLGVTPGLLLDASPLIGVVLLVAAAGVVVVVVKVVLGRKGAEETVG